MPRKPPVSTAPTLGNVILTMGDRPVDTGPTWFSGTPDLPGPPCDLLPERCTQPGVAGPPAPSRRSGSRLSGGLGAAHDGAPPPAVRAPGMVGRILRRRTDAVPAPAADAPAHGLADDTAGSPTRHPTGWTTRDRSVQGGMQRTHDPHDVIAGWQGSEHCRPATRSVTWRGLHLLSATQATARQDRLWFRLHRLLSRTQGGHQQDCSGGCDQHGPDRADMHGVDERVIGSTRQGGLVGRGGGMPGLFRGDPAPGPAPGRPSVHRLPARRRPRPLLRLLLRREDGLPEPISVIVIASTGHPSAAARIVSLASVSGADGWDCRAESSVNPPGAWFTHIPEPMQTPRSTSTFQRSPITPPRIRPAGGSSCARSTRRIPRGRTPVPGPSSCSRRRGRACRG